MMKKIRIICFLLISICFSNLSYAGVEYVVKETEGRGLSLPVAINNALLEAIAQVSGKSLEGEAAMASLDISTVDNEDSSYFSSDAFAQTISEQTKGFVKSYNLIDKHQGGSVWVVTVQAKIATYKQEQGAGRKRIAIMPIRMGAQSYVLAGSSMSAGDTAVILNQQISDYLTGTRKFTVLDREYMQESLGEKALVGSGATPIEEMAILGQQLSADYMIVGTLNSFKYSVTTKQSKATGRSYQQGYGRAELGFRLINVPTQQIVVSDTLLSSKSDDGVSGQVAASYLAKDLASKLSKAIHEQIYPVLVVAATGSDLVLGEGGKALQVGDIYKLYKYGDKIYDPYTKEYMGRSESYVGKVKIERVTSKQSYAVVIESDEDVSENFVQRKYLLREKVVSSTSKPNATVQVKKMKEERKNQQENDDDW